MVAQWKIDQIANTTAMAVATALAGGRGKREWERRRRERDDEFKLLSPGQGGNEGIEGGGARESGEHGILGKMFHAQGAGESTWLANALI